MRPLEIVVVMCVVAVVGLWAPARGRADQPPALRRFALLVGANDGGPQRATLRYAASDAHQVEAVLRELGGVEPQDVEVVIEPSYEAVEAKIRGLGERLGRVRDAGQRTELVFYYSGHSDEQGLRIGEELVPYRVLREWLDDVPADVRIAVLDSCASGTLTRLKGGKHRAPFVFDASTQVQGHAFLTSSSENEAAQESDHIGGSFFTHYFVSGLRGAADTSGDGKVTLTEAYRFAFDETLARTGHTQGGAQHPAYDLQLVGSGDLVMTDLRSTSALLGIDGDVEGRLFIHDDHNRLVAELYKPEGRSMELGVPSGTYTLRLYRGEARYIADVTVADAHTTVVAFDAFEQTDAELTASRGDAADYELRPVTGELYDRGLDRKKPLRTYLAFNLVYGAPDQLQGVQLGLLANGTRAASKGVQAAFGVNLAKDDFAGMQMSTGGNFVQKLSGVQWAGGVNSAKRLSGVQLAAGLNMALEQSHGVQVGMANWAREHHGLQLGMANLAQEAGGLQLALLNVATGKVDGVQMGMVNYADEANGSIGLVPITRKGGVSADVEFSSLALINVGLRLNARYTHTLLTVGVHPLAGNEQVMFGGGIGVHLPVVEPFSIDLDVLAHFVFPDYVMKVEDHPNVSVAQLRLMARWQLMPHLTLIAGPSMNFVIAERGAEGVNPGFDLGGRVFTDENDRNQVKLTPGFAFGMLL